MAGLSISTSYKTPLLVLPMLLFAGFVPVSCIALHVLDFVPLYDSVYYIALPVLALILSLSVVYKEAGKLVLKGWVYGIIAVFLYDLTRIPFMLAGWADFIPHIGDWLLNRPNTNPLIGYLWRYIGNGGGMGISFLMMMELFPAIKKYTLTGILYGLFIFLSLIATILVTPENGTIMFKITPLTFTGSIVGHIVFGWVVGYLVSINNSSTIFSGSIERTEFELVKN